MSAWLLMARSSLPIGMIPVLVAMAWATTRRGGLFRVTVKRTEISRLIRGCWAIGTERR